VEALSMQAMLAMKKRNYENAISKFDQILELDKKSHVAYGYKGLCLAQLGKFKEAIPLYEKALEVIVIRFTT
jgi:tetratricopeptide (TPR) repeat protein